jgi:alkylation response protein AidB-like acyl-CoA dehydrogenase
MDLTFTAQEEAFRDEVRRFLADKLPRRIADKVRTGKHLAKADMEEWHAILNARGWLASHWPEQYGGPGWTTVQKFIFDNECALAHAPRIVPFGLSMLGPVLIKYGSEAQKRHWLPRILNGSDWWCQGYSEPGAGSDLASLRTAARRDGDHYVVNGQKTWTTLGQHANMIFCLVRTEKDAKKQEGISFLLIDMRSPGVEVRPIITLDGEHEVNEVFFTDVRVPVANLVGEENKGWTCAKYLLTYERTNIAGVGFSVAALERLKRVVRTQRKNGRALAEDPAFAARLARVEIELENMKTTNLRVIAAVAGGGVPGLYRRAMGPYAQPFIAQALEEGSDVEPVGPAEAAPAAAQYFNNRKLSIFGGSNEIQRNIITKMILGL